MISGLSYFYVSGSLGHGFPFHFAQEASQSASAALMASSALPKVDFNFLVFGLDLLFWWLLFSMLLVIIKNYVFDN
jgi:uncharacterized ion transporter superfamily protein YfcC